MKIKLKYLIYGFIYLILVALLIRNPPQWFDKFGLATFGFFALVGYWIINKKKLGEDIGWLILIWSILGLVVDAKNVFGG